MDRRKYLMTQLTLIALTKKAQELDLVAFIADTEVSKVENKEQLIAIARAFIPVRAAGAAYRSQLLATHIERKAESERCSECGGFYDSSKPMSGHVASCGSDHLQEFLNGRG